MEAVDERHQRPGREGLGLEDENAGLGPAEAEPLEDDACEGSVREVDREPDRAPVSGRERPPENANVGVGRSEEPLRERLGGGPRGRRRQACECR